jgi:UDP-GlcNAc:undecaprenyl-phosphate/decaprenyl-phosphate GlcNAc-1-phosphate transferase
MREYALVLLVTAAVTYLLVPLVRRFALATHALQAPRARDMHTEPTPRLGGLAMFGGLIAGLLVASRLTNLQDPFQAAGSRTQSGLLLAGGLIVVIGFIDDRWGMGAVSKLAGQIAAAGILVWSGQALPWFPEPGGHELSLEPDLSVTLTILLVVITINAINFIDGMDGLAAGIVAVTAIGFLVYSYRLVVNLGSPSQSLPAVSSALLAGMCIGFLPHNFYPARIFMGDTGSMLLGLLLAYGPISSTGSLDPAVLVNYSQYQPYNRFGTFLPLLVPAAIFLIPYTDLMLAVIRRTRRGLSLMDADKEHLHHRLMGVGHSYRLSVLIMWLWAALLSATVVALSFVRTDLWIIAAATVAAVLLLLPVTMPTMRPWRLFARADAPSPEPTPVPGLATARAVFPAQAAGSGPSAGLPAPADRERIAPASAFAAAPVPVPGAASPGVASPGVVSPGVAGPGTSHDRTSSRTNNRANGRVNNAPNGAATRMPNGAATRMPNGAATRTPNGAANRPSNGSARRRGAEPGGPPPGFEPLPAPPGMGNVNSGAFLWQDGRGNTTPAANGNGNGNRNGNGNGADEYPFPRFPDDTEPGLRPFPGAAGGAGGAGGADQVSPFADPFADPFPRAGRLPDAPDEPQLPDDTDQFPIVPHS